jgi:hypothetical protein
MINYSFDDLSPVASGYREPDTWEEQDMSVAAVQRVTERDMLDLLRRRFTVDPGNGPRYVYAEHVRNSAGFDASRTCDFMALDTWPSSGLALHGMEVKVSRADWLRELKQPAKAAAFMAVVDYWWLVCPKGVADVTELPPGWGMMTSAIEDTLAETLFDFEEQKPRYSLRIAMQAPRLNDRLVSNYDRSGDRSLPRSFAAALLRATARTAAR